MIIVCNEPHAEVLNLACNLEAAVPPSTVQEVTSQWTINTDEPSVTMRFRVPGTNEQLDMPFKRYGENAPFEIVQSKGWIAGAGATPIGSYSFSYSKESGILLWSLNDRTTVTASRYQCVG